MNSTFICQREKEKLASESNEEELEGMRQNRRGCCLRLCLQKLPLRCSSDLSESAPEDTRKEVGASVQFQAVSWSLFSLNP